MKSNLSLQQLAVELERRKDAKQDFLAPTTQLQMNGDGSSLAISSPGGLGSRSYTVNDVAHDQIAARLGIPVKYYNRMRREDPELLAANVNNWFNDQPETRMVRTIDGVARAFLSDRYNRIENEEIAQAALPSLLGQDGVTVESCAITETRMYIKAVSTKVQGEVVKGDVVQAGVVISNSEVGMGAVKIEPMIFRLVCTNGLIVPQAVGSYAIRHLGGKLVSDDNVRALLSEEAMAADDRAVLLKVRDVVAASFTDAVFQQNLSLMQGAAQDKLTGNPAEAVKMLAKKVGLNEFEEGSVLRELISGGDTSRWGLINAVTATAKADELTYDRATELETLGGSLLGMARAEWDQLAKAA